jgi:hypothetical protein
MILFPAGRFLTMPFPPLPFAARLLAAVILPPLLFFAIFTPRWWELRASHHRGQLSPVLKIFRSFENYQSRLSGLTKSNRFINVPSLLHLPGVGRKLVVK